MTKRQAEMLAFLRYEAEMGRSPSFVEMQGALSLSSKGEVRRLITALEERGKIERLPHRARAIRIIPDDPFAGISTDAMLAELRRRGFPLPAASITPPPEAGDRGVRGGPLPVASAGVR